MAKVSKFQSVFTGEIVDARVYTSVEEDDILMQEMIGQDLQTKTSSPPKLSLMTLDGHKLAEVGDWVIKRKDGLVVMDAAMFRNCYTAVSL